MINLNNITKEQINLIVDYLKQDKIIVYPTDTIYGLGCIAADKKAISKIYKIKRRKKNKPFLILVSSYAMLKKYCYANKKQIEYLKKASKNRPVSAILKSKTLLPKELTAGLDSIAVRLPKNDFLIKLIKKVGVPIVSTSVNVSGKKNLTDINDIEKWALKLKSNKPDLIIRGSKKRRSKPSKLIDLRDVDDIKILRK